MVVHSFVSYFFGCEDSDLFANLLQVSSESLTFVAKQMENID